VFLRWLQHRSRFHGLVSAETLLKSRLAGFTTSKFSFLDGQSRSNVYRSFNPDAFRFSYLGQLILLLLVILLYQFS